MGKNFLKFWGTRGSCPVSGPEYHKYGGNTCSLELRYENVHIIFDAGTAARPLGDLLMKEKKREITFFLSHLHWDHVSGFPFFDPIYHQDAKISIWAPGDGDRSCRDLFEDLLSKELFPVRLEEIKADIAFRTLHPKTPHQIGPITLDFHTTQHPGSSLCFKIKTPKETIGYVTDNEAMKGHHGSFSELSTLHLEPYLSLIDFLSECDVLIHEAQYFPEEYLEKEGWGHSSIINAALLIAKTKVPKWLVTHHDPKHTDKDLDRLEQLAKEILSKERVKCEISLLRDGLQIDLL